METYAGMSGAATLISFFVATLPIVQWCAALMAVVSGAVAVVWGVLKIVDRLKDREVQED